MKKIVIIGNGFDIAHRLPTTYGDFMRYIKDSIVYIKNAESGPKPEPEILGKKSKSESRFIHKLDENGKKDPWIGLEHQSQHDYKFKVNPDSNKSIYFKSLFNDFNKNKYWSSLESHYFELLKENSQNLKNISILNKEFDHLKKLLGNYLKNIVEKANNDPSKNNQLYQMLIKENEKYNFKKHFFITFNYTSKIIKQYTEWIRKLKKPENVPLDPIFIHGDLLDENNPIIFGYGDDNSDEYKKLQDLKDKEILKNFKTFQYLRSNRYRQVLGILEEKEDIYVQIIGHSCDTCDKTLLRTIFEHPNVKHIEATYHESENKYFENLYNISRIFDDNSLMRQKIVPLSETYMIK